MMYVYNLRMGYGGIVELHQVYIQEQKCNMGTNKFVMVKCLDKYEVAYCDEEVVACLYLAMLACLDNNNKDGFYLYFLLAYPMEQIIEETLETSWRR